MKSSPITNGIAVVAGAAFGVLVVSVIKDYVQHKQVTQAVNDFVAYITTQEQENAQ